MEVKRMSHPPTPEMTGAGSSPGEAAAGAASTQGQLPTLQRNALRKVFDRSDFTASEVALLGHRRLERAEGIGGKGLATIIEWLRSEGYELAEDTRGPQSQDPAASAKAARKLEKAMRVLQSHGYTVLRSDGGEDDGQDGDGQAP
jgi:GNAT superfamily N-acetyltransferase